jgi:hypothetical protein
MPVDHDRKEQRGFAGLAALALVSVEASEAPSRGAGPWDEVGRAGAGEKQPPPKTNNTSAETKVSEKPSEPRSTAPMQAEPIPRATAPAAAAPSNFKGNILGVCFLLLIAGVLKWNASDQHQTTQSPPAVDYSTRSNVPPVISPTPPVSTPESEIVTLPLKGSGKRTFTIGMIRWCLFQQRRITYLREKFDNSGDDMDASIYNEMVDDYSSRCASFQYVETDMVRVRTELAAKEQELKVEAARIWAGWLRQQSSAPDAPATSDPVRSEELLSKASNSKSGSSIATVDQPSAERPREQLGFDLLRIEDAKKVQLRLIALKYLIGPADGLWTSRSRTALREFKIGNALPRDDFFDTATEIALFSSAAVKKVGLAINGNKLNQAREPEGMYPPPTGATLNPLNSSDAIVLQKRLSQQGYFKGKPNGLWGLASRSALRDFKAVSNLPNDDQWDGNTEQALMAEGSLRASDTFIGGWGEDQNDCDPTQPGGARLRINTRQAEIEDVTCRFAAIRREESGWRVTAECAKQGKKWSSDVKIEASGGRLTWTSNGETNAYLRCR